MAISPEKVKFYRRQNGWSQEALALAAGVSLRTIQRVEKEGNASDETQMAIASALNLASPQALMLISNQIEAKFKRRTMMQSLLGLFVGAGAILMLFTLGGELGYFTDFYTALFLLLFTYGLTAVSFGGQGLVLSVKAYIYLFSSDINESANTQYLARIITKQIIFAYAGAAIGFVIGIVAIFSNIAELDKATLFASYAVALLIVIYALIWAEVILRPLAIKLAGSNP